jgi:hypothetical protein
VNAPPDYITFCVFLICSFKNQSFLRRVVDQVFKSNLTFCVVCVFNLQFEKSVFSRRVVQSQSTLPRQIKKNTLYAWLNRPIEQTAKHLGIDVVYL